MRIATIADRATVVNIIVAMFKHNPTIQFMVFLTTTKVLPFVTNII